MKILIICTMIALCATGLSSLVLRRRKLVRQLEFVGEFNTKYLKFIDAYLNETFESHLYNWLIMNMDIMQLYLGSTGKIHYVAPFGKYEVSNYHVVINTISKLNSERVHQSEINFVHTAILRFSGEIQRELYSLEQEMKNPTIWFRNGVRDILGLPFSLLSWFQLVPTTFPIGVKNNWFFKIITGIVSLVMFLSGVTTIIVGYDAAIQFFQKLFN